MMNKLVKTGMMLAGVAAMLGIAGCGSPESEYQDLLDDAVEMKITTKADAEKDMNKFKKMTPEQQKETIKQAKACLAMAKAYKE